MIIAKIDVTKIDEARLFAGKNGAKYLDVVLVDTPNNQYGNDFMVCQSVSKEERERGVKGAILGNAKKFGETAGPTTAAAEQRRGRPAPAPKPAAEPAADVPEDDVPF